ncbi:MAG TPA: hypothetical protein VJU15_00615 [Gemmatimonadales bacterium]|nr:hypothetical protein [Gemmatimonadales bacterium]
MRLAIALLLGGLLGTAGCRPRVGGAMSRADSSIVLRREARLAQALAAPDSGNSRTAIAKWHLGKELHEISGLTLTEDGRLFAHADESGRVYEVDYRTGRMVKNFKLGQTPVREDFEAIASVRDSLFLLTSKGVIYQFKEGEHGSDVAYVSRDTGLKDACEFEGLAFDARQDAFLLLCKNVFTKTALKDSLVIYRLPRSALSDSAPSDSSLSRVTVPLDPIIGPNDWKGLHPSDITVDPESGNYVIVAADERAMVQITPEGQLVAARALGRALAHVEGVAITRDHILIMSTEGDEKVKAAITLFRWPERR